MMWQFVVGGVSFLGVGWGGGVFYIHYGYIRAINTETN